MEVTAEEGRVCRWSMYGFAASDSGSILEIYRRYGIVDVQLGKVVRSDVYPENNQPPPQALRPVFSQCDSKVNDGLRAIAEQQKAGS